MTEVKIANYTLLTVLVLIMATFWISISTLNQNNNYDTSPTIFVGSIN